MILPSDIKQLIIAAGAEAGFTPEQLDGVPVEVQLRGKPITTFIRNDDDSVKQVLFTIESDLEEFRRRIWKECLDMTLRRVLKEKGIEFEFKTFDRDAVCPYYSWINIHPGDNEETLDRLNEFYFLPMSNSVIQGAVKEGWTKVQYQIKYDDDGLAVGLMRLQ